MKDTLKTQRLTLRPLNVADAAWFASYAGAPEIARMTGSVTTGLTEMAGFTAARTHEEWFSMGRMEKAKGVTLTLEIPHLQHRQKDEGLSPPSRQEHSSAIRAIA